LSRWARGELEIAAGLRAAPRARVADLLGEALAAAIADFLDAFIRVLLRGASAFATGLRARAAADRALRGTARRPAGAVFATATDGRLTAALRADARGFLADRFTGLWREATLRGDVRTGLAATRRGGFSDPPRTASARLRARLASFTAARARFTSALACLSRRFAAFTR
jgi:hypothetical protein